MAGAGSESLDADDMSRGGAETGGATTSTVCVSGTRELAKSRCASCGGGAITVGASGVAMRILSRETFGAGGMMLGVSMSDLRLAAEFSSGEGGATLIAGRVGAVRLERRPSAGGGPGLGLKASRLATAESE